jgi:hypothetical protein
MGISDGISTKRFKSLQTLDAQIIAKGLETIMDQILGQPASHVTQADQTNLLFVCHQMPIN